MSSHREPNQPNFDRVAALYRWAEYLALGPILQRARTHLLPHLAHAEHALILGDGDGRFLEQLLLRNPHCQALAVDSSAAMLHRLRRRCLRSVPNAATRLHTLQQNILTLDPPPATDLVVTHFVLDCLRQTDVNALTTRLAAHLAPGALWLVSDFALPPHRILRPFAALYIRALYAAFRLLTDLKTSTLPDPQSALHNAGLTRIHRHTFLGGLIYTELWRLE
ncbi:MAG TPA: class I SAM-dependent methyltransferase [Acidobacteriaceae bacterium]|jgi:trans-aconitate methyltransferase|nr:class I SAM-dependent methyltransferase [Acidobacteriaceae bacterium]